MTRVGSWLLVAALVLLTGCARSCTRSDPVALGDTYTADLLDVAGTAPALTSTESVIDWSAAVIGGLGMACAAVGVFLLLVSRVGGVPFGSRLLAGLIAGGLGLVALAITVEVVLPVFKTVALIIAIVSAGLALLAAGWWLWRLIVAHRHSVEFGTDAFGRLRERDGEEAAFLVERHAPRQDAAGVHAEIDKGVALAKDRLTDIVRSQIRARIDAE